MQKMQALILEPSVLYQQSRCANTDRLEQSKHEATSQTCFTGNEDKDSDLQFYGTGRAVLQLVLFLSTAITIISKDFFISFFTQFGKKRSSARKETELEDSKGKRAYCRANSIKLP